MTGLRYSRRAAIGCGAALAAASAIPGLQRPALAAGQLVITDQGGASEEANTNAYYKPFEAATGTKMLYSARPNLSMGQLKAMVQAGHVE
ncbi:MAG: ABC transporter substrate-binding protein, partial [Vulcanimicrobiaceae bacterium]